jgi:hypothetical protein
MPKDKVKGRKPTGETQRVIVSALPWMLGLPGQVRLSAREQQPKPPVIAVGKKRVEGR